MCSSFIYALALNEHLNYLSPGPSPSDVIKSPQRLKEVFGKDKCQNYIDQVPAMIFNPALVVLQQRLENLEQVEVTRPDVERVANYLCCAVDYYDNETASERAIKRIIDSDETTRMEGNVMEMSSGESM